MMNNEKTFAAIKKLQEVELELHRLKNALEMANKALDAKREWVGLTEEEIESIADMVANEKLFGTVPNFRVRFARFLEDAFREKNT